MLEVILSRENMTLAYKRVKSNGGAPGVDGMRVEELRPYLKTHWTTIKTRIIEGSYQPQSVRRVEIPKIGGGMRKLGIPTVIDRLIQQGISRVMSEVYETKFSEFSYGFRPGRKAHDAVHQAQRYLNDGYIWIVDIDMEKFFDRVNHDRLMSQLSKTINDKPLLRLIRRYLEAGVMDNGVVVRNSEGTPQGGPLSPLLSNIVLTELDEELSARGLHFVRYADDCSIYVKSERAAERVLASITGFIEDKLRLRVNREKSGVRRPSETKLLGFSFYRSKGEYRVRISPKSVFHFIASLKVLTKRRNPIGIQDRLKRLKQKTDGWVTYFCIADAKELLQRLDGWLRFRLRMCIWKQWKLVRSRFRELRKLGLSVNNCFRAANTRKSYCRTAHNPFLQSALSNKYLRDMGYSELSAVYFLRNSVLMNRPVRNRTQGGVRGQIGK